MKSSAVRIAVHALVTTAVLLAATAASATESRYREFVVGERAAGMGGAAIAIGHDVDAVFANPAGLASADHNSFSLSANLYGIESTSVKNGLAPGDDTSSSKFVSVPSAMGGVARLSPEWVAGFGVFTPKKEEGHILRSRDNNSRSYLLSASDQTMWLGPAIAWRPKTSRLSLGAAVFGVYRDISENQSRYVANAYNLNFGADLQSFGMFASFGATYDLGDGWSVGANVHTPNMRLWDDGKLTASVFGHGPDDETSFYSSDVKANNRTPWQFALGIGRECPGRWSFGLDTIYHPATSYSLASWKIDGENVSQTLHLHSVLDISLGGEIIVADLYPIRAGIYTALSATRVPADPESTDLVTSDVDMYGVTFSVGRRMENISVSLGIDYAFGEGHDLGYTADDQQVRTHCRENVFLCSVSTSYHF